VSVSDPLTLPLRLDADRRALRETLWLRGTAALITIVSSAWLTATQNHWVLAIGGALAGGFAIVWLRRGLRDHAHALHGDQNVLLDHNGITHQRAGEAIHVGWDNVVSVDVDEDRLIVNLACRGRPDLIIEPCFGGLGVYDLQAVIAGARKASRNG